MQNRCGTCENVSCRVQQVLWHHQKEIDIRCQPLSLVSDLLENRGPIPDEAARKMDTKHLWMRPMSRGLSVNCFASPFNIPELQNQGRIVGNDKTKWDYLTEDDFKRIFKIAVKRQVCRTDEKYSCCRRKMTSNRNHKEETNHSAIYSWMQTIVIWTNIT